MVFSGVRRLSIPSSSLEPKRPHALPRGPSFLRGREENEGVIWVISSADLNMLYIYIYICTECGQKCSRVCDAEQ